MTSPELPAMSMAMTMSLAFVAAGGALGSVARYLVSHVVPFPWGTLAVNVAGSFAIGIVFVAIASRGPGYLFLVAGVLGGFTTFSAFSLDTLRLIEGGRFGMAIGYVTASLVLSILACLAGLITGRGLT